jgi:Pyruvate/2-oxoacid:ferredoxin oxidoreductase gamma subunit
MTKIKIEGSAGQGVKFLSTMLAYIIKDKEYEITLINEYSPLVRAGASNAYLVISKEKIENPIVEDADLNYNLNDKDFQESLLKKYNNKKFMGMVLLGMLLKEFGVTLTDDEIKNYFGKKFCNENLEAIKSGCT